MAIKVPDVGGQAMLNILFGATAKPTTFTLALFTDAAAPADTDINTTHEVAVGGGYAAKTLSNNATVALNSGIPEATWALQTWTFTGPLTNAVNKTIKGYQILSGTTLLYEEVLDQPFTPNYNGDQISITPKFQLGNGTPA
jgi:hypothetical protein